MGGGGLRPSPVYREMGTISYIGLYGNRAAVVNHDSCGGDWSIYAGYTTAHH